MNNLITESKQRGATLLISLVLLLVLTILALVAARSASLQQRMASNLQQQNMAFQAAENGIQAAILKLSEDAFNRPQSGTSKYLSMDMKKDMPKLPDWLTNECSTPTQGYCVTVEEVDCSGAITGAPRDPTSTGVNQVNLSGGVCYRITSNGSFENAKAAHQQGYMF